MAIVMLRRIRAEEEKMAEAHIASLDEEPECLQIRRNFLKYHGSFRYMACLADVTLRKITVQSLHGCKERIAISMKHAELFEYLKTHYMGSHITGELETDDKNHFQKSEPLAEKAKPEVIEQEQLETDTDGWRIECESPTQEDNSLTKYSDFSGEIINDYSGEYEREYEPSMQFMQSGPIPASDSSIGIDERSELFATFSDGTVIEPSNLFRQYEKKLKISGRSLSRKKKLSANWRKEKHRLNRIHKKIRNCRQDFLHKLTTDIGQNHAMVVLENLQIKNMTKSASGIIENPEKNVRAKSGLNI
jgi:hypothetical protein